MSRKTLAALSGFLVVALFGQDLLCAQELSQCKEFIVNDTASITTDLQLYEKVKHSFCTKTFTSATEAEHEALNEGVPLPIADDLLSLKVEGNIDKTSWNQWKQVFCRSDFSTFSAHFSQQQLLQSFSHESAEVIKSCLAQVGGLYGNYEILQDRKQFVFKMRYRPFVTEKSFLSEATIQPPEAVKNCHPSDPFRASGKKVDLRRTLQVSCGWDQMQDVTLTVNSTDGDQWVFALPSLPPIPPPPKYETRCDFDATFSLPAGQVFEKTCAGMRPNSPFTLYFSGGIVAGNGSAGPQNSTVQCQLQTGTNSASLVHNPSPQWTAWKNLGIQGMIDAEGRAVGSVAVQACAIGATPANCTSAGGDTMVITSP